MKSIDWKNLPSCYFSNTKNVSKLTLVIVAVCGIYVLFTMFNSSQAEQHLDLSSFFLQNNYTDELPCTDNITLTQANQFQKLFSKNIMWSGCYANDYLEKLYLADLNIQHRQKKLFFDVGANKGYTIASWLATWMPDMKIDPKSLHVYLSQTLNITDCGACLDCNEKVPNISDKINRLGTTLEIHAFEPMSTTFQALLQVRTHFNISRLFVNQLAVSNTTGMAMMNKCPVGVEICGFESIDHPVTNETAFSVPTITLDDYVQHKKIKQTIDLLKIDTEGADPLVLLGAKNLFLQQQIRMLIFENHGIGVWRTTSLLEVIQSLNNNGFTCHMVGKTGMMRLTNCWSPVYDIKNWSNILCVHRREVHLRRFLDELLIIDI